MFNPSQVNLAADPEFFNDIHADVEQERPQAIRNKCLASSNRCLTSSKKDATRGGIASSNKCHATSNNVC